MENEIKSEYTTELFNTDTSIFSTVRYTDDVGNRYKNLMRKTFLMLGLPVGDNEPVVGIYDNVAAWLLLNFCSSRARKHFVIETTHWKLTKLDGDIVRLYRLRYSRMKEIDLNDNTITNLLREMSESTKYVNMPSGEKLNTLYKYMFGRMLFYKQGGRQQLYSRDEVRYSIGNLYIIFKYRYNSKSDSYVITNKSFNNILEVGGSASITQFTYLDKVYNIEKFYAMRDRKFTMFYSRDDSLFYEIYLTRLHSSDICDLDEDNIPKTINLSKAIDVYESSDKDILVCNISKYENYMNECEKQFVVVKETEGCGLLLKGSG